MKKVTFTVLTGLAFVAVLATGCKKEGCTDSAANNYDSEAKKDDGTCTYTAAPAASLYTRLGGDAAITAVTDTFIAKVLAQPTLLDNFVASGATGSASQYSLFRERLIDQLCAGFGGPCIYRGKTMLDAHTGMNVTQAEFDLLAAQLVATLNQFGVPTAEKNEVLAIVGPMAPDVVGH